MPCQDTWKGLMVGTDWDSLVQRLPLLLLWKMSWSSDGPKRRYSLNVPESLSKNPHKCPSVRLFSHWLSLSSQMVFDGVCVIRTHTFPHKHTCRSSLESIKNHPNVHIFSKCHIDGLELNPKRSCYDAMMLTSFSPWIKKTRTKSLSYKYQISQQLLEYFQQPNIAIWHTSLCF